MSGTMQNTTRVIRCTQHNCYLCTNGVPPEAKKEFQQKGWHRRLLPTFVFLENSNHQDYQHLANNVFHFISEHWDIYFPYGTSQKPEERAWKDSLKALLCRRKHQFENGKKIYGSRGWWKIKNEEDKKRFIVEKVEKPSVNTRNPYGRMLELKAAVRDMQHLDISNDCKEIQEPSYRDDFSSEKQLQFLPIVHENCSIGVLVNTPYSPPQPQHQLQLQPQQQPLLPPQTPLFIPAFGCFPSLEDDRKSESPVDATLKNEFSRFLMTKGCMPRNRFFL